MVTYLWIFLALLLDGLAGLAGGLLPERALQRFAFPLVAFAVGALLAAALVDLLPEAWESLGARALAWAFGAFLVLEVLERAVARSAKGVSQARLLVPTLLGADALHNVTDGAAIAAAFLSSGRIGLVTTLAVVIHELPEEVGDFVLLRRAGVGRAAALAALAGVQMTAVGGALAVVAASQVSTGFIAVALALAAGSFVSIGAGDLMPELLQDSGRSPGRRWAIGGGVVLGAAAVALTHALVG